MQIEAWGAEFRREPLNEGVRRLLHVAVEDVGILLGASLISLHNSDSLLFDLCERHFAFKWLFVGAEFLLAFLGNFSHVEDLASCQLFEHFGYFSFARKNATADHTPLSSVTELLLEISGVPLLKGLETELL